MHRLILKKPPVEFVDELNHAFQLEDAAIAAANRWGLAPEGHDREERVDRQETAEELMAYATELYANVMAHRRVAGRLGGTKKPTQLDISMAILKEFMALNETMTVMSDSIRAGVGHPTFRLRLTRVRRLTRIVDWFAPCCPRGGQK